MNFLCKVFHEEENAPEVSFFFFFLGICQIDLAFIVDTSRSMGYFNFLDMLGFIKKVEGGLIIGPEDVQVAMVSFSDAARTEFRFGEHEDHASLQKAIN